MRKLIGWIIVLAFSMVLAACDGGGISASTSVKVTMFDFQFTPNTFTAPSEAGTYQIVCAVPGHVEAGMIAKLVVIAEG